MGVHYTVTVCYGIAFDWDEIQHMSENKHIVEKAKELGYDDLNEIWYELGFISVSPYYDCPYTEKVYVIGVQPPNQPNIDGYDASEFKEFLTNAESKDKELRELCEKYDLPYVKPRLFILNDVC